MYKKLIYFVSFVCVLSFAISAQATPLPVSVNPSVEAVIGVDGVVPPQQSGYKTYNMQIINTVDQRRVTLVSYNISGLKKDYQKFANMTLSNLGGPASGTVDVYGVIESQDNISSNLSWTTAPGVANSQTIQYPVMLDKADLTGKLLSFKAPALKVRESTGTSQALDDFLNSDTDGTVTFLLAPASIGTNALMRKTMYPGGGMILEGEITTGINIVFVSFHAADDAPSAGAAGAGLTEASDVGYTDLLNADGHNVTRFLQTGTPDVNVLNAADLVIISRSVASGSFQNAAADTWNTLVTTPIINLNGYTIRKSRLGFMTGSNIPDTTGDIKLTVNDPTHPIFAGISLTDGTMDNPYAGVVTYPNDPNLLARGISIITDPANAYGTVLATVAASTDPNIPSDPTVGSMVIAEWPAGAVLTHDGGAGTDVLAGHRLTFMTGSREASGINSETAGLFDLFEDGAQMFLNAVVYMVQPVPAITIHTEAPTPGPDDISNFVGAPNDAENVGGGDDATTYVAHDRGGQGQTFLTGDNEAGYLITGVWVQQAGYTDNTGLTWYRMQAGSQIQIRVTDPAASGTDDFALSTEVYTITGTEENALPSVTSNSPNGLGLWFHVPVAQPVTLAANTEYGFDLTSISGLAGVTFFELLGIDDSAPGGNPYPDGTAYVSGASGHTDNVMTPSTGDHVFVVELEAL
jgi:hypothetical protein